MLRRTLLATALIMVTGSAALAETYGDKVKDVDPDRMTLTLVVDGKDRTFHVHAKVDARNQVRAGKRLRLVPVKDGLIAVKPGNGVTVTTERKDGEEVATKIVLLVSDR